MALALRRVASALTLALSACFNPSGNESDTAPTTGTAATTAAETVDTGGPTSAGPTSDPTTAVNTDSGPPTSGTSDDPSSGTTALPESCSDKQQSGDETDLDCGGSCAPCEADLGCLENSDCVSMACLGEKCLGDPACLDDAGCDAAVCFLASCVDFACKADPQTGPDCDDGLVCTADSKCDGGVCKGSSPEPIALAELPGDPSLGLFYDGIGAGQLTGSEVGDAGDFNGDGTPDLYVSTDYNVVSGPARVYVLFGGPTLASATLTGAAAGDGGLMIELDVGSPSVRVAAPGDVDGDGKDDLVLGTSAPTKTILKGGAYVIPGRLSTAVIKLSAPPPDVVLIMGPDQVAATKFGDAVAALGDTNDDGIADFAVAAPSFKVDLTTPGAVFVVRGSALLPSATIEEYVKDNQAYRIVGAVGSTNLGVSVAGVGDFNNDDLADLAIGQPSWMMKGRVYVLYSEKLADEIQLGDTVASGGLVVTGKNLLGVSQLGLAVGGAGDFNSDGFSDLLVGGAPALKQAMVVFGGTLATEIDASTLVAMQRGQAITTVNLDGLGAGLGGGHDVNGDMIDDVVFGAPLAMSGQSYVVFGSQAEPAPRTVTQLALGMGGYAIAGAGTNSESGASVALVPSVNGDEFADVFVGAPQFDVMGANNEGRAYVVYGGKCGG